MCKIKAFCEKIYRKDIAMKYALKAIHYTRKAGSNDVSSPCLNCVQKECSGLECKELCEWLKTNESVSVEWEQGQGVIMLARIICRTLLGFGIVAAAVAISYLMLKR